MDVVFERGEASAADVRRRLPDAPGYTAVRTMLNLLEKKGLVKHEQPERKYVYSPCQSSEHEGRLALQRVLRVFFDDSLEAALAAHLLDPETELDPDDLKRLKGVLETAANNAEPKLKREAPKRTTK